MSLQAYENFTFIVHPLSSLLTSSLCRTMTKIPKGKTLSMSLRKPMSSGNNPDGGLPVI